MRLRGKAQSNHNIFLVIKGLKMEAFRLKPWRNCLFFSTIFSYLILCQAAFVRDVIPRTIQNNLGKPVNVAEAVIDFELCTGHADESVVLNVTRRDGSTLPLTVKCEGVFFEWETELIQVVPAATTQKRIATCESHEDRSALLELTGRQATQLDSLSTLIGELYQGSNFLFGTDVSNATDDSSSGAGRRRRSMTQTSQIGEGERNNCSDFVLNGTESADKYFQRLLPIDATKRCPGYETIVQFWSDFAVSNGTFRKCDLTKTEYIAAQSLYVAAHPLCKEESTKEIATLENRFKWMSNQYGFSKLIAESNTVAATLYYEDVQRCTTWGKIMSDPIARGILFGSAAFLVSTATLGAGAPFVASAGLAFAAGTTAGVLGVNNADSKCEHTKADLLVFREDLTGEVLENSVQSERLRQILSVGPYDKQHACIEAQAHYLYNLLQATGADAWSLTCTDPTAGTYPTGDCKTPREWIAGFESRTTNFFEKKWEELEKLGNHAESTEEEFVEEYYNLLTSGDGTKIHINEIGISENAYIKFTESDFSNTAISAQFDSFDASYQPLATKRHVGMLSSKTGIQNVVQWQWDPPCIDSSLIVDNTLNFSLLDIEVESHAIGNTDCGMRLNTQDNRCKFIDRDAEGVRCTSKDGCCIPEEAQCVPHFVETRFPNVSEYWNSLECIEGLDEQTFFCGLVPENEIGGVSATEIVQKCFGPGVYPDDARQSLIDSLIQRWDDEGFTKYSPQASYTQLFCADGTHPNENDFLFRPYTNFRSGSVELGKECPCACTDKESDSGMRTCPLNPWEKLDSGSKLTDIGQTQACVRNRGLTACQPIWSQKYSRVPFDRTKTKTVNRCDSELIQNFTTSNLNGAVPDSVFGDLGIETFLAQLREVQAAGYTCGLAAQASDIVGRSLEYRESIGEDVPSVANATRDLQENPCGKPSRSWNVRDNYKWNWEAGEKNVQPKTKTPSLCHEAFWHALDDICLDSEVRQLAAEGDLAAASKVVNKCKEASNIPHPKGRDSENKKGRSYQKKVTVPTSLIYFGDFQPGIDTGCNYWMDWDNFYLKNKGRSYRKNCISDIETDPDNTAIDAAWQYCNTNNNFNVKANNSNNYLLSKDLKRNARHKLMSCYEIMVRVRNKDEVKKTRWGTRSRYGLKTILNYVQTENPNSAFIKELITKFYANVYGQEEIKLIDKVIRSNNGEKYILKCTQTGRPDVLLSGINSQEEILNLQTYGYQGTREKWKNNKEGSEVKTGRTARRRKRKGVYDSPGTTDCIDSVVEIADHSDFRANLYRLTVQNNILATDMERYFQDQLGINKDGALAAEAKRQTNELGKQVDEALKILELTEGLNEVQLATLNQAFQLSKDQADQLLNEIDNLVSGISRRRETASENVRDLAAFVEDVDNQTSAAIEVYRQSAGVLEDAIQNTYGLVQAVLQTTSQTKELVGQTQALLHTIRFGDQDYSRHTHDVVEAMWSDWFAFNSSERPRGVRGAQNDERPFVPFVARVPATPPGPNKGLPSIKELGALPTMLSGKKSVIPVEVMRGWTLQYYPGDGHWHWVQQRVELLCSASGLFDSNQFAFVQLRTWTTFLGPRGCTFGTDGTRCQSCRARVLVHHCAIEGSDGSDGNVYDTEWRKEQEAKTLYNKTWAQESLNADLEDLETDKLLADFGCLEATSPPVLPGLSSSGSSPWMKAERLPRIEIESAYVDPINSTLQAYRRALADQFPNRTAVLYRDDLGSLSLGLEAPPNATSDKPTPVDVPLATDKLVTGVSAADVFTWQSTLQAMCEEPLLWSYPNISHAEVNGTDLSLLGSPRMVWVSGRGYDGRETLLGSVPVRASARVSRAVWSSEAFGLYLNDTNNEDLNFDAFDLTLAQAESVVCSPDLSLAFLHSELVPVIREIWEGLEEEDVLVAPFKTDFLHAGVEPLAGTSALPAWLLEERPLFEFVSYEMVESLRALPYSLLFREMRAARTGLMPPEGLETRFVPRILLPAFTAANSQLNGPGSDQTLPLESEVESAAEEESEAYQELVDPIAKSQKQSEQAILLPTSSVVTPFDTAAGRSVEPAPRPFHREGRRCYESVYVATSDLGLPLYRWRLRPGQTEARISITTDEPVPDSEEWRNLLSGVQVVQADVPESLTEEFREFYWLGNLTCLQNGACLGRDGQQRLPPHIYDLERADLSFSRSPFADSRRKINAVRLELDPSAPYGPLLDKANGETRGRVIPDHLLRAPSFEEYRSQWFPFPQQEATFAKRTFSPSQATASASEHKRLVQLTTRGDARCVETESRKTNCRFLEHMRLESVEDVHEVAAEGHAQKVVARSAATYGRRAPLTAVVRIPEDVDVRGRLATSACPQDLRVLNPHSHQVALQAYVPGPGSWQVEIEAWESINTSSFACVEASPLTWEVGQTEISQNNHYAQLLLPKGLCPVRSATVTRSEGAVLCVSWTSGGDLTAYANTSLSTAYTFSFGYALHEATVKNEMIDLLAGFSRAERNFQYLVTSTILSYQETQIRKTTLGWVAEPQASQNASNSTSNITTTLAPSPSSTTAGNSSQGEDEVSVGTTYTSEAESANQTDSEKGEGAGSVDAGGGALDILATPDTDPSLLNPENTAKSLDDMSASNSQAVIISDTLEIQRVMSEVVEAIEFLNASQRNRSLEDMRNFSQKLEDLLYNLENQVPSFLEIDMINPIVNACVAELVNMTHPQFRQSTDNVIEQVQSSTAYNIPAYADEITKKVAISVGATVGLWVVLIGSFYLALQQRGFEFAKYLLWTKEAPPRTKCCSRLKGNKVLKFRLIAFVVCSCLSLTMWLIIF